jgi:hypothetical protein
MGSIIPPEHIAASPTITAAFYTDAFCVGQCSSSCLEFSYLPINNPAQAAKVQVYCTIYPRDGDWLLADETDSNIVDDRNEPIMSGSFNSICIGTGYIDVRRRDTNGWLSLECYDKIAVLDSYTVKQAATKLGVTLSYPLHPAKIMSLVSGITGLTYTDGDRADDVTFTEDDINKMSLRNCAGYCTAQSSANLAADELGKKIKVIPLNNIGAIYNLDADIYIDNANNEPIETNDGKLLYEDESNSMIFIDSHKIADLDCLGLYESIQKVRVNGADDKTYTSSLGSDIR